MPDRPLLSKDGSVHVTDEFYNTLISSVGAILAAIGSFFLVSGAWRGSRPGAVLGFSIYGLTLINMFVSSALHHGVNGSPKTNHHLRQLDYFAIFMLIAGTFTPFCLIVLRNSLGWSVLGIIWSLAVTGIAFKAFVPHAPKWLLTSLFIGMGWLGLMIVKPVSRAIHWQGISALVLGGVFFTVGGLIYALEKPNPVPGRFGFHEIWHCFVFAGAASHFFLFFCFF
ncbi:MAG TPA: hemolysin III family protein [bacterium]|nr:hemolysin III family protein [bacterium]